MLFFPRNRFWEEVKLKCLLKVQTSLLSCPDCTTAFFFFFFPLPKSVHWYFLKYIFKGLTQLFLTISILWLKELYLKSPVLFPCHLFYFFFFLVPLPTFIVDSFLSPNFLFEVAIFMQFSKSTHSQCLFIYLHFLALVLVLPALKKLYVS